MMNYQDAEQKRRIKIIVIATIAAVVVLALGIWVVIAAVNSIKGKNVTVDQTIVATETTESTKTSDEDKQKNNPTASSPATQYTPQETTVTTLPADTATETAEDIPSTGPVDTALAAVLVGVAVYLYTTNVQLVKKQIVKRQA